MGKPAARMGDTTAHGGSIILGCPTVLIGKMPASAMGDMHVCPMCTPAVPPIPHVGGPIMLGSTGVLIGKKPAARLSDMAICVGPPSMPAMGCMTVLLGEAGSGSQAGSAASAVSALAAKAKGPKAITPFPLAEPPEKPPEIHSIECDFLDSAGKSLAGIPYKIKDPDGNDVIGVSTSDGKAYHDGYIKAGSFSLVVPCITNVKWSKTKAGTKDKVKYSAKVEGFEEGDPAYVTISEVSGGLYRMLEFFETKVSGEKVEGEWQWSKKYLASNPDGSPMGSPHYTFMVVAGFISGNSDALILSDTLKVKVTDPDGKAVKDLEYELVLPDGQIVTGKVDERGIVTRENVPPGKHKLILHNKKAKEKKEAKEAAAVVKPKYGGFGDLKEVEREQEAAEREKNSESSKADLKVIKRGDQGPIVEELNIRLAGFGGGHLTDKFGDGTEKALMKFQLEWMKEKNPSGILDEKTAKAFDAFTDHYHFNFDQTKCKCHSFQLKKDHNFEKCDGYGMKREKGKFNLHGNQIGSGEKDSRYERPGMHRSTLWALKGVMFYLEKNGMAFNRIDSGYRCWADNEFHSRTTTNHLGKALDIHIDKVESGRHVPGGQPACDKAREYLKKELGWVEDWKHSNIIALESVKMGATTWVHFDVREFLHNYLLDEFYCKTEVEFLGEPLSKLFKGQK